MVMVRKTATAILLLALLLLGYQPINAPMAGVVASTMDMDMAQPCCPDCDEPAQSDGAPCRALAGCVLRCTLAPPSFTVPTIAMPVFYSRATASPLFDDLVTAPDGTVPPFRPPRLSILA